MGRFRSCCARCQSGGLSQLGRPPLYTDRAELLALFNYGAEGARAKIKNAKIIARQNYRRQNFRAPKFSLWGGCGGCVCVCVRCTSERSNSSSWSVICISSCSVFHFYPGKRTEEGNSYTLRRKYAARKPGSQLLLEGEKKMELVIRDCDLFWN